MLSARNNKHRVTNGKWHKGGKARATGGREGGFRTSAASRSNGAGIGGGKYNLDTAELSYDAFFCCMYFSMMTSHSEILENVSSSKLVSLMMCKNVHVPFCVTPLVLNLERERSG